MQANANDFYVEYLFFISLTPAWFPNHHCWEPFFSEPLHPLLGFPTTVWPVTQDQTTGPQILNWQ